VDDLGYLRHGSFGRATVRWPGGLRRVAACALARAGPCLCSPALCRAVRPSYGLAPWCRLPDACAAALRRLDV